MKKNALFLGGTTGLGCELARLAIADHWNATVAGRLPGICPLVADGSAEPMRLDLEDGEGDFTSVQEPFNLIAWTAGVYQAGPFLDLDGDETDRSAKIHFTGPIHVLATLLRRNQDCGTPCHLIVVGSTSSYIARPDESVYGALKAAKAQLARALGKELPRDLPGSKVLLACPGGMATPFWEERDRDVSAFMDPAAVARAMWRIAMAQTDPFLEIRVLRQPDRNPKVEYGPQLPQ